MNDVAMGLGLECGAVAAFCDASADGFTSDVKKIEQRADFEISKADSEAEIFAIDPGTEISGWVRYQNGKVIASGVTENSELLQAIQFEGRVLDLLAIEMIASYGMPVGREVFETCVWIGRFIQAWPGTHRLVYRKDVKMHLCGTPRAKDANVRQVLLDKVGAPGVKRNPGPTYGVKSHAWAALGVAVTAAETEVRPA